MNRSYPTDMSIDGLHQRINANDETVLRCAEEAETRTAQARMAESDGDSRQALLYHAYAQSAKQAAMLAKADASFCKSELARRASRRMYAVTVLCDGGEEVQCVGEATSARDAETNAFWSCQEQMLRPVSAEAVLQH